MDSKDGACGNIELISEWPITASSNTENTKSENTTCSVRTNVSLADNINLEKRKSTSFDVHDKEKKPRLEDVDFAETVLAKWWRQRGRKLFSVKNLPRSTNPKTLLYWVSRTEAGKTYLSGKKHQLKMSLKEGQTTACVYAALASLEERLGELESAAQHIDRAISLESHNCQYQWMAEKVKRLLDTKEKQQKMLAGLPPQLHLPSATQVDRVSSYKLTVEEFHMKYAKGRIPVIITDVVDKMTQNAWTLQHIKQVAGDCTALLKKPVTDSVEWARLEDAESMKVKDFIDHVISGDLDLYLFDWSLPHHCPPLAEELTIPKYFAGDFLPRLDPGSQYRDSWPSLFVAPAGLTSGLHVDTFASNFWMALFQGRKRWILYPAVDQCLLYPQLVQSMDPTFEVDVTKPDLDRFPLLSLTHPVECILQPGDVLFVPAGCPHHVTNLETSVAISANFVDSSNIERVKEELRINALIDPCAADLVKQMQRSEFSATQDFNIDDLQWKYFKKVVTR